MFHILINKMNKIYVMYALKMKYKFYNVIGVILIFVKNV